MNNDDPYSVIQSFRNRLVTYSLPLTGAAKYFEDWWPTLSSSQYKMVLVYIAIPVIIWATVVYLVFPILLGRPWFRRRVLGSQYIEGYWFEWNVEQRENQERDADGRLSVIFIRPNQNKEYFVISGDHHDGRGVMDKHFSCFPYRFIWPKLEYVYSTRQTSESGDVEGNGEFDFRGAPPDRFAGSYAYGRVAGSAVVSGRRLTPEEVKKFESADLRGSLIRKVIAEYSTEGDP